MKSKSSFWLVLHHLAGELQAEANNDEARVRQLIELLETQPPTLKVLNCANLDFVAGVLNRLNMQCRGPVGDCSAEAS